jgi:hypothetical protein
MFLKQRTILVAVVAAGLIAFGTIVKTVAAAELSSAASAQTSATSAVQPLSQKVDSGTTEALRLLQLMDMDKNGKVSSGDFMAFMAAEFDRLDINRDAELDVKELERS